MLALADATTNTRSSSGSTRLSTSSNVQTMAKKQKRARVQASATFFDISPRRVVPHTTYHTDGAHVEDRVVLEDPRPLKRQCVPGDSPPSPPTPPATADDESQPEPAAQKVPKKQVCLITQLVSMYSLDDPERIRLDGNLQSPLRTAARSHPGTRRKSVPGRDLSLWPACHRALSRLLSERDSVRSVHGVGTSP